MINKYEFNAVCREINRLWEELHDVETNDQRSLRMKWKKCEKLMMMRDLMAMENNGLIGV